MPIRPAVSVIGTVSVTGSVSVPNPLGVNITSGGNIADVRALTNSKSLDVAIVDGSGNQITSFGGGTEYASGATVATPTGKAILGQYSGHVYALQLDAASGNLKVVVENSSAIAISGAVTISSGSVTVSSGSISVTGTVTATTNTDTTIGGTTAPSKGLLILGKTCDVTPAYDPIPLSIGGTEVVTAPAIAGAHRPGYKEQLQVPLSVDLSGFLRVRESASSLLGDIVTSDRYNQIEANFSQTFDAAVVTLSHSGTASDPTQAGGQAIIASGTGTTGDGKIVTVGNLSYRPGHEWFAYFTAAFTAPTDTAHTTFQRIGPASATDGFYIGFELIAGANTFAFSSRLGSVDTHTKYADFNADLCNGGAFSAFTVMGTPQAIDFTKINIFRIHGAWFGAAPVLLEVFSPDGIWVVMHRLYYPNTLTAPSTATTTYKMFAEVSKTSSDSTNLKIFTPCWALGTCDDLFKISDTLTDNTLASITRSVLVGHTTAGGGSYVNVKVNPSGALSAAVTAADGDVFVRSNAAATFPVTANSPSSTAAGSTTHQAVASVNVLILASNASRKECIITNTGTTVIYLGLGTVPTITDYHIALAGCTNADDGSGNVFVSDMWKGDINAISSGAAGKVVTAELT